MHILFNASVESNWNLISSHRNPLSVSLYSFNQKRQGYSWIGRSECLSEFSLSTIVIYFWDQRRCLPAIPNHFHGKKSISQFHQFQRKQTDHAQILFCILKPIKFDQYNKAYLAWIMDPTLYWKTGLWSLAPLSIPGVEKWFTKGREAMCIYL